MSRLHTHQKGFTTFSRLHERGFTFIELILVIGIIGILFSIATFNLVRTQHMASVSATVDTLIADMRSQQTKAMVGSKDTTGVANSYGVHFTSSSYILFQGTSDPGGSSDFTVTPEGVTFTTNLPSNMIVFGQRSGEFTNYVSGTYTVTIRNANGTEQRQLTVNKYGIVTNIQ